MAKDSSFDIVSECDMQEVENAFNNTRKALAQRYDLKDSGSSIEFDKAKGAFSVLAPSDFVTGQIVDLLNTHLIRRKVDIGAIEWGKPQDASGGMVRTQGSVIQGIDADTCRKINKDIKAQKFKVKVQIEGTKLRVFSPKRDDLQAVIAFLRDQDYGLPLQYTNYR